MWIFRLLAALLLVQLSVVAVQALQNQPYSVSLYDVINAVEKPFRTDKSGFPALDNIQADFFQRSTIAEKKREFRADGEMLLKPASSAEALKFRFDYFRPTRHEIVCDGRSLWIYLPENRQVILSDLSEFFTPEKSDRNRGGAVNFLQGLGRISKDFTVIFSRPMTDPAGNFILELTPMRASVTIEKLFITVNRESVLEVTGTRAQGNGPGRRPAETHLFPILSTTVVDHDGNSTTIEFSNIRTNGMVPDMMFSFNPPADAFVVRPPARR
jgi:outer membrane lipoprotein-sorting protein